MVFYTREGKPVAITPHLLRHVFATHAVQVEKVPLDVMGEMLKQKNLEVTDYYSQPTGSMVAGAADMLLARFASHLDVGDTITRTPSEVRQLYEEAQGKVGALAEVIGGQCVQPGFCPAEFACIGCPANAVDPAMREQIEHRIGWLGEQRAEVTRLGLQLEVATLESQLRDCHTVLREMKQIEQYRKDEAHGTFIAFDTLA